MFQIGDTVIYSTQGVCEIIGIEDKEFLGAIKSYFVLKPAQNDRSTYFVPTDNEKVLAKLRKTLSKQEIDALIDAMPETEANWIADDNHRREQYSKILATGNHTELIRMIKAIFYEKKRREADGKHLHASDERFLKDAEQLLHGEFQYVLNLAEQDMIAYIVNRIETNEP